MDLKNEQTSIGDNSQSIPPCPQQFVTGDNLNNRYIAYCGIDCTVCPRYQNDCAEGCLGSKPANDCGACAVRRCSLEKLVINCAYCDKYPCEILKQQYANMKMVGYGEWATIAQTVLDEIRRCY
ncbi:MAG: DUF3795 domain-containing protein [Anaerolineaceae bacterium]